MPAREPVSERACMPWSWIAMASSAALIRSPAVSSMSSSRGGGSGETLERQAHEIVGGVAHRRDHHDDVVAQLFRRDNALGTRLDAVRRRPLMSPRTSALRGPQRLLFHAASLMV